MSCCDFMGTAGCSCYDDITKPEFVFILTVKTWQPVEKGMVQDEEVYVHATRNGLAETIKGLHLEPGDSLTIDMKVLAD